ncbi:MAG: prolyl oligopeptidase family serine peptidase [Armatimonadetes bacterium]|nr:prolyl oligopeptidase family serine peptidase [Armatimonadota bacterium]
MIAFVAALLTVANPYLTSALVIPLGVPAVRTPAPIDPLLAKMLHGPIQPAAGKVEFGDKSWKSLTAGKDGFFEDSALEGGYAAITYEAPKAGVYVLTAEGDSLVYVNGEIHAGDPYGYGYLHNPVNLRKGPNQLLFLCGRGRLRVHVEEATATAFMEPKDVTVPDVLDDKVLMAGAIPVINATDKPLTGLTLESPSQPQIGIAQATGMNAGAFDIQPRMTLKRAFIFRGSDVSQGGELKVVLKQRGKVLASTLIPIRHKKPLDVRKNTFLSQTDGSVQYYGVRPATKPSETNGLVVSLHGAGVEAIGQAEAYGPHEDYTILCPTNRRPFGFDWELWGRLNAVETVISATVNGDARYPGDLSRIYLTGHSMGGHGTWQLGVFFPEFLAAIAPSAGWLSFGSYAGGLKIDNPNANEKAILEAMSPSNTELYLSNLKEKPVSILHGGADDNVPVSEARTGRKLLQALGNNPDYHEEPGAGHWWSTGTEPGARCVDWPGFFKMFDKARTTDSWFKDSLDFVTPSPEVNAGTMFAIIELQQHPFRPSRLRLTTRPSGQGKYEVFGTTENIEAIEFYGTPKVLGKEKLSPIVELDGQRLNLQKESRFKKKKGRWIATDTPSQMQLHGLHGSLTAFYSPGMTICYGTHGSTAQNAWMLNYARLLSEQFYYRGNGRLKIAPDADFVAPDETNVILIGNAETNSVWRKLPERGGEPIGVLTRKLFFDSKQIQGRGLAGFYVRPRGCDASSAWVLLGVTDAMSQKIAERIPLFLSGTALPDYTIFGPDVPVKGTKGIIKAGWFDNDWKLPK